MNKTLTKELQLVHLLVKYKEPMRMPWKFCF